MKKVFIFLIRWAILTITLIALRHLYEIELLGYFLVLLTSNVWSIYSYIDCLIDDEK